MTKKMPRPTSRAHTQGFGKQQALPKPYKFGDLELSFGRYKRVRLPFAIVSGYGLLLGWSSLLLWSDGFAGEYASDYHTHALRACLLAAMVVALFALPKIAPLNAPERIAPLMLAVLALSPWASISSLAHVELPLAIPFWVLTGLGNATLLHLWHACLVGQNQKRTILIMGGSFVVSGTILLLFHALQPGYRQALALVVPVLSLAFFLGTIDRSKKRIQEYRSKIDIKLEKSRFYNKELFLSMPCNGFVGFLGSCATMSVFAPYAVPSIGFAFALAGIIMVATLLRVKKNVAFEFLGLLLPYVAFWLFVFALAPNELKALSIAAMVTIFSCFEILSTSNMSRNSRYLFSDYVQGLSSGRACNRLVFLVGWIAGYFAITLWMDQTIDLVVIALCLLSILSVGVLARLFRLGLEARNSRRSVSNKTPSVLEANAENKPGGECATIDKQSPDHPKGDHAAIRSLARSFQLSSRETEVLILLSQGRNARFISGELIISINTVKSHAYNIYGKLDVHSQQELIDLVQKHQADLEGH